MKPAVVLFSAILAAGALAQDPGVGLVSGGQVRGAVLSVDAEGATVQEGDRAVRVPWQDVASIRADRPVAVVLAGGDRITLTIEGIAEGRLQGRHETLGAITVPLASLARSDPPAPVPAPAPPPAEAPKDPPCCPATPLTPKPITGKVALSATGRSGNVDSVLMALHVEAQKDCEEDRLSVALDALYGKTDDELTAASLGGKGRWDHFYTKTFFSYASAEALYDDIQNLDLRAIVGIGAGDFLWKCTDDRSWSVEAGISALYEDYSTRDDVEIAPAARLATVYKDMIFTDLKFEEALEVLVPLDDFGGYLVRSKTTVGVPVCQDLALRLSLQITYDGNAPDDTEALDILGLVGIEYQF